MDTDLELAETDSKLPDLLEALDETDRARALRVVEFVKQRSLGARQERALEAAGFTRATLCRWRQNRPYLFDVANAIIFQGIDAELLEDVLGEWPDIVKKVLRDATSAKFASDRLKAAEWIRAVFMRPLSDMAIRAQDEQDGRKPVKRSRDFTPVTILVQQQTIINNNHVPGRPDQLADMNVIDGEVEPA